MTTNDEVDGWVPQACILPTAERPMRLAEFDDLFATALRGQQRPAPNRLRWQLDPVAEATVRDLAARESACCSFFTFSFTPAANDAEALDLEVRVPAGQVDVLDALAARAAAGMPG
jgi:hypothetical protein